MKERMTFFPVEKQHRNLVRDWLHEEHIRPYFYGEGLQNTLKSLDAFIKGMKNNGPNFAHWIACLNERPFGLLMTSKVEGPHNPNDPHNKWYEEGRETITLDLLIGEKDLLGKGLGSTMIQKFLLDKFAHIDKVLIDPAEENSRAIHVYEKAGFRKVEKFTQQHDEPKPCWMMHLDMKTLSSPP